MVEDQIARLGWGCPKCLDKATDMFIVVFAQIHAVMARNTSYKYQQDPIYKMYNPIKITSYN
jgi:hypothetical protein